MLRRDFLRTFAAGAAGLASRGLWSAESEAWSFGVISDTQWAPPDGRADRGVAGEIIDAVNRQFIAAGVKFVVAVGDITNNSAKAPEELDIRARHNAALTAAGIRCFPLRGNHDYSLAAAQRFPLAFPGLPGSAGFRAADGFSEASSPALRGLAGLSYSFSYRDVTCVLLDQFVVDDGSEKGRAYPISVQLDWMAETLAAAKAAGRKAFVFGHKNLLGQSHKDNLFGDPTSRTDPGDQGAARQAVLTRFVETLRGNGVRYYLSGHDHQYYRAMVEAEGMADGAGLQQIISGSCSYKFYSPQAPYSPHDHPLIHQRNAVGYVIVTVDGPLVTARYYAVPVKPDHGDIKTWTDPGTWVLQDEFGYSLNGQQWFLPAGASLSAVRDQIGAGGGFVGTSAALLDGVATGCGTTLDDDVTIRRQTASLVTTGWAAGPTAGASDTLTLRGLRAKLGSAVGGRYVLSMSSAKANAADLALCSPDARGTWVNAVRLNASDRATRVAGPCPAGAPVGTWGYDAATRSHWAVLDHDGRFAIARPR